MSRKSWSIIGGVVALVVVVSVAFFIVTANTAGADCLPIATTKGSIPTPNAEKKQAAATQNCEGISVPYHDSEPVYLPTATHTGR